MKQKVRWIIDEKDSPFKKGDEKAVSVRTAAQLLKLGKVEYVTETAPKNKQKKAE